MKNILIIGIMALTACNPNALESNLKTAPETTPEIVSETQNCQIPAEIQFEKRLIQDLNGNRILVFYGLGPSVESAILAANDLGGPEASSFHTGISMDLPCLVDGEGPFNCSGPAFVLTFPTQQQIDDFAARCLDTEHENQLSLR